MAIMLNHPNIFRRIRMHALACLLLASGSWLLASPARAQYRPDLPEIEGTPTAVPNPPIISKPNAKLPLDLTFKNSDGKTVKLGDLFHHDKPIILSLVYFSCPNLCGFSQESVCQFVREAPHGITLGKDYDIVVVSIDPDDTPKDAAVKRKNYLGRIPLPETQAGFTYLTGTEDNIKTLADTVGFPYRRNPPVDGVDKYAHAPGIFICTADGHLSQTILGIQYEPETVHYRLLQASDGKIGSGLLGFCLSCGAIYYNPNTGRYEHNPWFYAGTATGLLTILLMGTFLTYLWRSERKRSQLELNPENPNPEKKII
jgi:protein SCO1/2